MHLLGILTSNKASPWAAWLAVVGYMALIFFLSGQSRPLDLTIDIPYFDVAAHVGEYGVLSLLIGRACRHTPNELIREEAWYVAIVGVALYGLTDEGHQALVYGRTSEWKDWASDVAGAALAQWGWSWWARRKKKG